MGELQVETQRHPRRGHANHVPCVAQDFAFERALRRARTAVRIEDVDFDALRPEHSRQTPHSQGRREERVFPAMWVVRAYQKKFGQALPRCRNRIGESVDKRRAKFPGSGDPSSVNGRRTNGRVNSMQISAHHCNDGDELRLGGRSDFASSLGSRHKRSSARTRPARNGRGL